MPKGGFALVRIVIAGAGYMGGLHADRLAQIPDVQVTGVLARDPEHARKVAASWGARATTSLDELLDIPSDAVDVCLPTDMHARVTLAALSAGRHVICEKPIALTISDAQAMIDAADRAGRLLLIAHVLRFWPEYGRLRELVAAGTIGKPTSALARRLAYYPSDPLARQTQNGGPVVDLQIHDVDFLQWVFDSPATAVQAAGTETHPLTTLTFPSGAAVAEAGMDLPRGFPFSSFVQVRGERGLLTYSYRAGGQRVEESGGKSVLTLQLPGQQPERPESPVGDAYTRQLTHFIDCIRRGEPSPVLAPGQALAALRTSLLARAAIRGDRG